MQRHADGRSNNQLTTGTIWQLVFSTWGSLTQISQRIWNRLHAAFCGFCFQNWRKRKKEILLGFSTSGNKCSKRFFGITCAQNLQIQINRRSKESAKHTFSLFFCLFTRTFDTNTCLYFETLVGNSYWFPTRPLKAFDWELKGNKIPTRVCLADSFWLCVITLAVSFTFSIYFRKQNPSWG